MGLEIGSSYASTTVIQNNQPSKKDQIETLQAKKDKAELAYKKAQLATREAYNTFDQTKIDLLETEQNIKSRELQRTNLELAQLEGRSDDAKEYQGNLDALA